MISRKLILDTMIKHETLTIVDMAKEENLGLVPEMGQLKYLLSSLVNEGFIILLYGATPPTYSITERGIEEGKQLALTIEPENAGDAMTQL